MNNNYHLNNIQHEQPGNQPNNRAHQILQLLESELKNLITDKRTLKAKFQHKMQEIETQFQAQINEIQTWFNHQWKEATKLENKFILLWDYWQREVKILALEKQMSEQILSTDRQEITRRLGKLISINAHLEKGFKERQIEPKLMEKLRKKIGAWEEEQ